MSVSVLEFWLSSLNMSCYYQAFIDNGYDDLEISKKVSLNLVKIKSYGSKDTFYRSTADCICFTHD